MNDTQKALKDRYAYLHPLIFQRALEKAETNGELFDILDTVPKQYPIIWDDEKRKFVSKEDFLQLDSKRKS